MHWSGEITLGTLIGVATLSIAIGALFMRLGALNKVLERLITDNEKFAQALEVHVQHDEILFRELSATLNRLVGKIGP